MRFFNEIVLSTKKIATATEIKPYLVNASILLPVEDEC
jgi:hypothetical protein